MNYIQGTMDLPLIFSIENSGNIKWYVDAEFAVHKDMRSHTGGFMTMYQWSTTLRKWLTIFQKKWRGNQPQLLYTTSLTLHKIQQNYPKPTQTSSTIFSTTIISFKEVTSRHPDSSILPMNYSERACHWWLQEAGEGDEVYTRNHCPTTDFFNWQVSKYKVVRWCIVCIT